MECNILSKNVQPVKGSELQYIVHWLRAVENTIVQDWLNGEL